MNSLICKSPMPLRGYLSATNFPNEYRFAQQLVQQVQRDGTFSYGSTFGALPPNDRATMLRFWCMPAIHRSEACCICDVEARAYINSVIGEACEDVVLTLTDEAKRIASSAAAPSVFACELNNGTFPLIDARTFINVLFECLNSENVGRWCPVYNEWAVVFYCMHLDLDYTETLIMRCCRDGNVRCWAYFAMCSGQQYHTFDIGRAMSRRAQRGELSAHQAISYSTEALDLLERDEDIADDAIAAVAKSKTCALSCEEIHEASVEHDVAELIYYCYEDVQVADDGARVSSVHHPVGLPEYFDVHEWSSESVCAAVFRYTTPETRSQFQCTLYQLATLELCIVLIQCQFPALVCERIVRAVFTERRSRLIPFAFIFNMACAVQASYNRRKAAITDVDV